MRMTFFAAITAPFLLAACDSKVAEGETGTSVRIDAIGSGGDGLAIAADGDSGKVAIKVPGFAGELSVPRFVLDDRNFDLDSVKLFPGSKIASINIAAEKGDGKDAKAEIAFTAPAAPAEVSAYLKQAFAKKKMAVTAGAGALSGTMADGKAFIISIEPGPGGTAGKIIIDSPAG